MCSSSSKYWRYNVRFLKKTSVIILGALMLSYCRVYFYNKDYDENTNSCDLLLQ